MLFGHSKELRPVKLAFPVCWIWIVGVLDILSVHLAEQQAPFATKALPS